jgi:flagellar biosynthetic protein FliP
VTAPAVAARRPSGVGAAGRRAVVVVLFALVLGGLGAVLAGPASAAPAPAPAVPTTAPTAPTKAATTPAGPSGPAGPAAPTGAGGVNISVGNGSPSSSITLILAVTVLAVAPSVLLLCTSFTKIVIVLGLTRNALGLQNSPPNQVITGIALFLTLFVMGPVLSQINKDALQPYLDGHMSVSQAYDTGVVPLKKFMLHNTRSEELKLMVDLSGEKKPADQSQVSMTTLIPAFVLSELKSAFIIGLVIFIPFLVLDMLVSAGLMSMGMMMVPPAIVSLPFKLLLFVVVDGWALITTALVGSYT